MAKGTWLTPTAADWARAHGQKILTHVSKPGPHLVTPVFGDDTGPIHPDHVRLRSFDPSLVLECRQGENPFKPTGGYGGWEEVDRPKQMPITEWKGSPPYRMEGDLLLDGWRYDFSVEPGIAILERMARSPGGDDPPPFLNVRLPSGSPRSTKVKWVIEDLDWGDSIKGRNGERVRQMVTVKLLQFVDDELLSPAKRRKKKKGKKGHPKSYTVPNKTTSLMDVAKRFHLKWQNLKKANPSIRDPRKNLRRGQKVKLG